MILDLDSQYIPEINSILEPLKGSVFVYGSRVQGKASKFSDLDLCYKGNFDKALIRSIKEKFRNSNLPIKVDLIAWESMSDEFRSLIKLDLTPWDFSRH